MPKQYEPPLVLTTPYMRGKDVKDAQWLMQGNNRHKGLAPYKDGKLDGVYGPSTAQATKRTKYWLGFPLTHCDQTFGQVLYEYLLPMTAGPARPLPAEYKRRRNERIAAAALTPGMKAYELAKSQVGYTESPFGSNRQKYGVWYGFNGVPWCAIFESWCFAHSGWGRFRYAAVVNIHWDAINNRNGMRRVWTPQRGDVVNYRSPRMTFAHTGFFDKWIDRGAGVFQDLGGNTSTANFSNGGGVGYGRRSMSRVVSFVRVGG